LGFGSQNSLFDEDAKDCLSLPLPDISLVLVYFNLWSNTWLCQIGCYWGTYPESWCKIEFLPLLFAKHFGVKWLSV